MRAGDLATPFPTVGADAAALKAARMLAEQNLPGLIVVDNRGRPSTILPGTQVLRVAVPRYCQEDPALPGGRRGGGGCVFLQELGGRTVAEVLPERPRELPVVDQTATVLEVTALMARARTPLVAVVGEDGSLVGAVNLGVLMDRLVGP